MNALAAIGNSQASLMAAFALPVANTAPVAPVTAAFVNVISLLLSSPNRAAPQATIDHTSPTQIASPAKIADAMIRSMLGNTSPTQTAGTDPILAPITTSTNPPPVAGTSSVNPPTSRKLMRTATESPMTTIVVAAVPQPIAVSAPPSTPTSQDSKATAAPIAESAAQYQAATISPRASSSEANVAFTALLTPIKDTAGTQGIALQETVIPQTASPAAHSSDAIGQTAGSTEQASSASSSGGSISRLSVVESEPSQNTQPLQTKGGGQSQTSGGQTSQQHAAPETPARSASEAKIKLAPQQGDVAPQTPSIAAGPATVTSLTADATRTTPEATRAGEASAVTTTPYHATAEALRTTEAGLVVAAAVPQARTAAAQEISIRIATADSPAVDLRVVERSGQIHVDVRTPDAAMQTSLRQDLGALTNSLARAGYHAETFTPSSTLNRTAAGAQPDNQQDSSQNRGSAGDFSGGRRQQQHQKRPGTWLEEMEEKS